MVSSEICGLDPKEDNALQIEGLLSRMDRGFIFPLRAKAGLKSQPVKAWKAGRAEARVGPSFLARAVTSTNFKVFFYLRHRHFVVDHLQSITEGFVSDVDHFIAKDGSQWVIGPRFNEKPYDFSLKVVIPEWFDEILRSVLVWAKNSEGRASLFIASPVSFAVLDRGGRNKIKNQVDSSRGKSAKSQQNFPCCSRPHGWKVLHEM